MPTSRIDIMTNDIKVFLLNSSFSIASKLLKFFINTVDKSHIWNPKLRPTFGTHYWHIARYLYVKNELK